MSPRSIFIILLLFISMDMFSQTYLLDSSTNGTTINTCSGILYDSGGASGNYSSNENYTITVCSDNGSTISLLFNSFDLESGYDFLEIYDGPNIGSPLFPETPADGNELSGLLINSSGSCFTINFDSDGSVTNSGWSATINCSVNCQNMQGSITDISPSPNPTTNAVQICQNEEISFSAIGIYPENNIDYEQSDNTSTFEWDFGDGSIEVGTSVIHQYSEEGIYIVNLTIIDINGCTNTNQLSQTIYVSTTPSFIGSGALYDEICLGASNILTGVVNTEAVSTICDSEDAQLVGLPDGSGNSFTSPITLNCFEIGAVLTDINDLESICLNMEHSYLGDLQIELTCPNNQSSVFLNYPNNGSNTFLGEPLDNDLLPNTEGVGYDYCFTNNPTYGFLDSDLPGASQPSGSYTPEDPLTNLIGCPLNGDWAITITDNLNSDNGFLFSWEININPNLNLTDDSFTNLIVTDGWLPDPTISEIGGNSITVIPNEIGNTCYTYQVMDDFNCTYDTTICFNVVPSSINLSIDEVNPLCEGDTPITLIASPIGGTWSGDVNADGTFNPIIGAGSYIGTYTITEADCVISESIEIPVVSIEDPNFEYSNSCSNEIIMPSSISTPNGEFSFNTTPMDGATIIPSTGEIVNSTAGSIYSVEYTLGDNCSTSFVQFIEIYENILVTNIVESCNSDQQTYTVSFVISEGDNTSYNVIGLGTLTGSTFVSDPIQSGDPYSFEVSDGNACTIETISGFYNCPCSPQATISGDITICSGSNGNLQIDFEGESPWTFVFAINGIDQTSITTVDNPYFLNIGTEGLYTLTSVLDNNCTGLALGTATVNFLDYPIINNIIETCSSDQQTYTVSFDISGGDNTSYNITGAGTLTGSTFVSDPITSGVAYNFDVNDINNCQTSSANGLYNCSCLSSAIISGDISLCSNATGDLQIDFEGESPWTFVYAIDGIDQTSITTSDNPYILSTGSFGTYSLINVEDNNCFGSIGGSATVSMLSSPTITSLEYECSDNQEFYTVVIGIIDGDEETYTSSDGNIVGSVFTSESILNGDTYSITITDTNNCIPINITSSYECSCVAGATLSGDLALCPGLSGDLQIDFTGVAPWTFVYEINGTEQLPITTSDDPFILNTDIPGVYTLISVADNECFGNVSGIATVQEIDSPEIINVEIISNTDSNEYVVVFEIINGDSNTYSVLGQGSLVGNTFTSDPIPLNSGYLFVVTDNNNCGSSVISDEPSAACITSATMLIEELTLCGEETGVIEIEFNGDGPWTFEYSIDNINQPTIISSQNPYLLAVNNEGIYTIESVVDPNCVGTVDGSVDVNYQPLPTSFIEGDFMVCSGISQPIVINITGSSPWTIEYSIDGIPQSIITTTESPFILETNQIGEYEIIGITDEYCTNIGEGLVLLENPPPIDYVFSEDLEVCVGDTAYIWIEPLGEQTLSYDYIWEGNGIISNFENTSQVLVNESNGVNVTVSDGCSEDVEQWIPINVFDLPPVSFTNNIELCGPGEVMIENTTPIDFIGNSCIWIINEDTLNGCESINYLVDEVGFFDVSLSMTSPQGCFNSLLVQNAIEVYNQPVAEFSFSPENPSIQNPIITFNNESSSNSINSYWQIGDDIYSDITNPTISLPVNDLGNSESWNVCLTVAEENGCTDTSCQTIIIEGELFVYVPTAFTPDGDGLNELFYPIILGAEKDGYEFAIFDRYGKEIFRTNEIGAKWNGSYNDDKDYYVVNGLYTWIMNIRKEGSTEKTVFRGVITIIR